MNRKLLTGLTTLILLVVLISNIAAPVFAQQNPPSEEKTTTKKTYKKRNFMDRMKLTEDQRKKMIVIRQKYSGKLEDIAFEVLQARVELAKELRKEEPNRENISKIITQISKQEEKKLRLIMDEFFEVRKILTDEQRQFYMRKFIRQITRAQGKIRH